MEPRTKKILFGCLGGCGFVVLVFVGSCVAFTVWINSPGEVLDPEVLLGSDTTGYAEWKLRLEDPGTAEFWDVAAGSDLSPRRRTHDRSSGWNFEALSGHVLVWSDEDGEAPEGGLHCRDADGAATRFFEDHGIHAMLARPDHVTFGVANNPSDVAALLDDLDEALAG